MRPGTCMPARRRRSRLICRCGTPFRLFNDLMATDWIPRELKREFLPGAAGVFPRGIEAQEERTEALHASIHADPESALLQYPIIWQDLIADRPGATDSGAETARRCAMAEDVGEPLGEVLLAEFYLRPDRDPQGATQRRRVPWTWSAPRRGSLGPDEVRFLLRKAIKCVGGRSRHRTGRVPGGGGAVRARFRPPRPAPRQRPDGPRLGGQAAGRGAGQGRPQGQPCWGESSPSQDE